MNSGDDDWDSLLQAFRDQATARSSFVCDYCGAEAGEIIFVNHARDSAVCWSCVINMYEKIVKLNWVNNINWNEQTRH